MVRTTEVKLAIAIALWLFTGICSSVQAEILIKNVKGYSFHLNKPQSFSAIAIKDNLITKVYSKTPDIAAFEQVIDGKGATLVPGMIDAHGHVLSYGQALSRVNLNGSVSEPDAVARVQQYRSVNSTDKWILGRGWNQELWANKQFPNKMSLDALGNELLIVLDRIDGHAIWVSSAVLKKAGIDRNTISPEGGEIVRDANGEATGVLIDNAMNLIYPLLPSPNIVSVKTALQKSLQKLATLGLTSVHDAGINYLTWLAYQELAKEEKLPIRVYAMLDVTDPHYDKMLKAGIITTDNQMLSIRSVKISSDGALGSRGAALHAEYSDKPGHFGLLLHDVNKLNAFTLNAIDAGFQVNTHAIGDKANTLSLNAFELTLSKKQSRHLRHRIEHAQVLRPSDFKRFQALGVIASIQPTHATSDKNMAENRLGHQRIKGAYAWQSMLNSGAKVAGGSDFPIEPAEPLYGIHAAVSRQDRSGEPEGGWYKQEGTDLHNAFKMFTYGGAYAAHQDNIIGSIEPGKRADFVFLAEDPIAVPVSALWQISVLQTWVEGVRVVQ